VGTIPGPNGIERRKVSRYNYYKMKASLEGRGLEGFRVSVFSGTREEEVPLSTEGMR
jgi:hypothetical protein